MELRAGDIEPDRFDRVAKLLVDSGEADSFEAAAERLRSYRFQVVADADACADGAWQAAILTAVNAGIRAMHGGVVVVLGADPLVSAPLMAGRRLSEAIRAMGGTVEVRPKPDLPTLVMGWPHGVGNLQTPIFLAAGQWVAALAPEPLSQPADGASTLGGVLAAAIAVGECFQRLRGFAVAGDRAVGVSLWTPGAAWDSPEAQGPAVGAWPAEAWLLGLGHLGQAYAWLLGLLPYPPGAPRRLVLQDDDRLSPANRATSMFGNERLLGRPKARIVAEALEATGWQTTIVERRYGGGRLRTAPTDPTVLLGGVDNPQTRRSLDDTGFAAVIDAGLGAGPDGFLSMSVRRLPAQRPATEIWRDLPRGGAADLAQLPAYKALERSSGDACGVAQLAGRTVATAFVGVTAATWVLGGLLRELHGGPRYELIDYSLRAPDLVLALPAPAGPRLRAATVPAA